MTYAPPFDPVAFAAEDVHCPACRWVSKGAECQLKPNDLAICPQCGRAVHHGPAQTPGVESGWDFEQGNVAKFGMNGRGFWLLMEDGAGPKWYIGDIAPKEAAGFARRILRVLELAGYQQEKTDGNP